MRREAVIEMGGVGVRFIEEEGRLAVSVVDVLAAAGFGNPSATWSKARERFEEAALEAREVRYETKLPGKKGKIITLPITNLADLLLDIARTTHAHGGTTQADRLMMVRAMRAWLMGVQPFGGVEAAPAVIVPRLAFLPDPTPQPAVVEVLSAVEPASVAPEVATPEEILAVLFEGKRLRLTPETPARVSLLDILAAVGYANPSDALGKLREQHPAVLAESENWQFPGERQRPTPVISKRTLIKLLNLASAPKLAPFREWSARTLERYLDGDPELAAEVLDRAEKKAGLPPTPDRPTMEQRLERARYLKEAAEAVAALGLPGKAVASLRLLAAEEATGLNLTHLKPPIEGGCVHTPEEVERRNGVPRSTFGKVAGELGLKGASGEGVSGLSEPYQNTANGGSRTVVCYRYSRAAVEQVLAEIERRKDEHN
jgi:hypothetical protein